MMNKRTEKNVHIHNSLCLDLFFHFSVDINCKVLSYVDITLCLPGNDLAL